MKSAEMLNTQRGRLWSIIQPNSRGLNMPLKLNPVETMPKARPAAPSGAALRTSMSRDGAIIPPRKPAVAMVIVSNAGGSATNAINSKTAALMPKQIAATWECRSVRSAKNPPASTPIALATR